MTFCILTYIGPWGQTIWPSDHRLSYVQRWQQIIEYEYGYPAHITYFRN